MKARLAKKLLKGMQVISLQPGEVLVLTVPEHLTQYEHKIISDRLADAFPRNKAFVVPEDFKFSKIKETT